MVRCEVLEDHQSSSAYLIVDRLYLNTDTKNMAKATSLVDSLGKELECAVCLEQYKEPKVLPCLHSFCKKCLEGLLTKETKNVRTARNEGRAQARRKKVPVWKINCPTCRISVEVR